LTKNHLGTLCKITKTYKTLVFSTRFVVIMNKKRAHFKLFKAFKAFWKNKFCLLCLLGALIFVDFISYNSSKDKKRL